MLCVLNITSGPRAGEKVWLRADEWLQVGRDPAADLALVYDAHMSRLHFALEGIENGFRLRDLGSTNGTFLNGAQIQLAPLSDGDRIVAGKTSYSVEITQDVPLAATDSTSMHPTGAPPQPPAAEDATMRVDRMPVSDDETIRTVYRSPSDVPVSRSPVDKSEAPSAPQPISEGAAPLPPPPIAESGSEFEPVALNDSVPPSETPPSETPPSDRPAVDSSVMPKPHSPIVGNVDASSDHDSDAPADRPANTNPNPLGGSPESDGLPAEEDLSPEERQRIISGTSRLAEGAIPVQADAQLRVDGAEELATGSAAGSAKNAGPAQLRCIESTSPHHTVAQVASRLAADTTMMAVVNRTQLDPGAQGMIDHAVARQHAWPISDTLYVVDDGQAARIVEIMERSVGRDAAICIGTRKGWNFVVSELRRQASLFSYPSMLFDELKFTPEEDRTKLFEHVKFMLFERDSTASWVLIADPGFQLPEDVSTAVGGIRARTLS